MRAAHEQRFRRFFFFNDPAPTEIYTLSLHDALPIYKGERDAGYPAAYPFRRIVRAVPIGDADRKSTRLNSSHDQISYDVFWLKKKKKAINKRNKEKKKNKNKKKTKKQRKK